jgi:hypothetical protein
MRTFGLVGIQKNAAWVRALLCKLQKSVQSTRSASDKVYQLFMSFDFPFVRLFGVR